MKHINTYHLFESTNSKSKIWYHGTDSDFENFDIDKIRKGPSALGMWFTDDEEQAKTFGDNIIKCRLSYNKPKVITMDKWDKIRLEYAKGDPEYFERWKRTLVSEGFDALFVTERMDQFAGRQMRTPNMVAIFYQDNITIVK